MNTNASLSLAKAAIAFSVVASLASSGAMASDRWFGYFANDYKVHENKDHTNITHIWAGFSSKENAKSHIMAQLQQAKAHGKKAIVEVSSFVFTVRSNGPASACPFSMNSNAASDFSAFVGELVSKGYLVPGNPQASTVVAFYPIDEPELCGLKDQGGNPHPALRHAVNVIRGNQSTYNFPLFSISSKKYGDAIRGLNLMDWIGMQNYSSNTSGYINQFSTFESRLSPGKRSVLVPQAAYGGMMSEYGSPHDPQMIIEKYLGSGKAIGIMPFLWHHNDTTGVGSNPALREQYRAIGNHIANNHPLPFRGGVSCIGGGGMFECFAYTFGGTPPYSYSWNPVPQSGGGNDWAIYSFPCGVSNVVRLTITDSSSKSWTGSTIAYCPPGSRPLYAD